MSFPEYKPDRLASLPPTLDPAEYDISPETRKAQAERLAIRSRLKREYLLKFNDPSRRGLIEYSDSSLCIFEDPKTLQLVDALGFGALHTSELQGGAKEDPALTRWTYARSANVYPNFRPTPKNSLLGAVVGIGPLFFWYYVFKTDRDRKEKLIQKGKLDRTFSISY